MQSNAYHRDQTGNRRQVSLGADQLDASFRGIEEGRLQANGNPRIVPLAWFRHFVEEQEEILGNDPCVYGLGDANRKNLETLMQYSLEQGLIGRRMILDEIFTSTATHS